MRPFVSAVYDVTVAVPKGHPMPSVKRFLKRQPSVVSYDCSNLVILGTEARSSFYGTFVADICVDDLISGAFPHKTLRNEGIAGIR